MGKNFIQPLIFIIFIFYFSVLVYLCCKDIKIYLDNEDSSSISFRKFNASPRDRYPVITLCLYNNMYNNEELSKHGYSSRQYFSMITGLKNVTIDEMSKIPDFSNVTIRLQEVARFYKLRSIKSKFIKSLESKDKGNSSPGENSLSSNQSDYLSTFYLSYQNPRLVCYSQSENTNSLKTEDIIELNRTKLISLYKGFLGASTDLRGRIYIYVHYKGQIVRSFGKEVFYVPMREDNINKRIALRFSGMTALRRRPDGKATCNPLSEGDDSRFQDMVMEETKCVPPYWKGLRNYSRNWTTCLSADQLKRAHMYSNHIIAGQLLSKIDPPCEEFSITSSVNIRDLVESTERFLHLGFQYQSDQYLEIRNLRHFGFIGLFSSIGGLIGIFLGFSLFQISEVIVMNASKLMDRNSQKAK